MLHHEQDRRRAIHADFGRTVEVVTVECGACFKSRKRACDHRFTDFEIAERHFKGWLIKGVNAAKRTRCPKCRLTK